MKNRLLKLGIYLFLLILSKSLSAQQDLIYWGLFDEEIHNNTSKIDEYTEVLGKEPAIVMWYKSWRPNEDKSFPTQTCINLYEKGYMPHIVWEPFISLDDILSGVYDDDLQAFGESIKAYGGPLMLRWGHEFNGDWYSWSDFSPETYISAYQYVHDKIEHITMGNQVYWIWCPNNENAAANTNDIAEYYPGDTYVDWLGIDGYNWGTSQDWSNWRSFADVFSNMYNKLTENYPEKPIMLGEMGCSSDGGDKASWITDFFVQINQNFPQIRSFCWFNINKETDWRFNTTSASEQAFAAGLNSESISGNIEDLLNFMPKSIFINGQKTINKGATAQKYRLSSFSEDWTCQWSITGNSEIQSPTSVDSVTVLWACETDTLKCTINMSDQTSTTELIIKFDSIEISGDRFIDENAEDIIMSVPNLNNASYIWTIPADATISGKEDTNSVRINWGLSSDTIKVRVEHNCGTSIAIKPILISGVYPYPDINTPHELPGIIESVNYDYGGEGMAYHDSDIGNVGPGPRSDEYVDTEFADGGSTVGWIEAGEWLRYSIFTEHSDTYFAELRVASETGNGKVNILINGENRFGTQVINSTGGWSSFSSIYPGRFSLHTNDTVLKYEMVSAGFNIGNLIVWPIDNEIPTRPQLVSEEINANSFQINWNASTDNDTVIGYIIYMDNDSIAFTSTQLYSFNSLQAELNYSYSIIAIDRQGNHSEPLKGNITTAPSNFTATNSQKFEIYPNPANNVLYIESKSFYKALKIRVFNCVGEQVAFTTQASELLNSIDISILSTGMYFVILDTEEDILSYKFLKK